MTTSMHESATVPVRRANHKLKDGLLAAAVLVPSAIIFAAFFFCRCGPFDNMGRG